MGLDERMVELFSNLSDSIVLFGVMVGRVGVGAGEMFSNLSGSVVLFEDTVG